MLIQIFFKYYKENTNWLTKENIDCCLEKVNYEFQKGGNKMFKIWRNKLCGKTAHNFK
jgi:hypothetical protein